MSYRNKLISLLLAAALVLTYMPALCFAEAEEGNGDPGIEVSEVSEEEAAALEAAVSDEADGNTAMTESGGDLAAAESADSYDGGSEAEVPEELYTSESAGTLLKAQAAYTPLVDGDVVKASDINKGDPVVYAAEEKYNTNTYPAYKTSSNYIEMPAKGILLIAFRPYDGCTDCSLSVSGVGITTTYRGNSTRDNVRTNIYAVSGAGRVKVDFDLRIAAGSYGTAFFSAVYAPDTVNTLNAYTSGETVYYHGVSSSSGTSAFNIKTPGKGYIILDTWDDEGTFSVSIKTKGFKDYEYVSRTNVRRYIGVKKGTYRFDVKTGASIYGIRVKFVKTTESKHGTKKKKAKTLKKKKKANGVIVTDAKKAHWYKLKVSKKQKTVKLIFDTLMNGGGYYGGLRVTAYRGKKKIGSAVARADIPHNEFKIYSMNTSKIRKGTYYVKVESYSAGNGKFTFKWK